MGGHGRSRQTFQRDFHLGSLKVWGQGEQASLVFRLLTGLFGILRLDTYFSSHEVRDEALFLVDSLGISRFVVRI